LEVLNGELEGACDFGEVGKVLGGSGLFYADERPEVGYGGVVKAVDFALL